MQRLPSSPSRTRAMRVPILLQQPFFHGSHTVPTSLGMMPTKNLMTWLFFPRRPHPWRARPPYVAAMALAFLLASFSADSARATLTNSFCYGPSSAATQYLAMDPALPLAGPLV